MSADHAELVRRVAVARSSGFDPGRTRPAAFWGMAMAIATESMLFAGLLSSYFFLRADSDVWPLGGIPEPELRTVSVFSVILIGSSLPVGLGERAVERGDLAAGRRWIVLGWLMGAAFLVHAAYELFGGEFGVGANAYASVFLITVGLHATHLLVGLAGGVGVIAKISARRVGPGRQNTVTLWSMYWHFVDAVWVAVFTCLYLSPRWA